MSRIVGRVVQVGPADPSNTSLSRTPRSSRPPLRMASMFKANVASTGSRFWRRLLGRSILGQASTAFRLRLSMLTIVSVLQRDSKMLSSKRPDCALFVGILLALAGTASAQSPPPGLVVAGQLSHDI